MSKLHRQRVEREKALLREPGTFDAVIDHIGNGGTLAQWCRVQDVRYTAIYGWIAADQSRAALFQAATESRKEFLKDVFLEDILRIRGADVRKFFDDNGKPIEAHKLPDDLALIVKDLEITQIGEGKKAKYIAHMKMVGQEKGVEMLGKLTGSLTERHELTGKGGGPIEIKDLTRNLSKLSDAELASLNVLLTKLGVGVPA